MIRVLFNMSHNRHDQPSVAIQHYNAKCYKNIINWITTSSSLAKAMARLRVMTIAKILLVITIFILSPIKALALEDGLQKAIEIAAQGNNIQSERLKIVAENIANEYTTGELPGSKPYRRKVLFVENKYDKDKKAHLLRVKKYSEDQRPFEIKYDPNHPAADENGYVKMPNVQSEIERSDAAEAQRAYEANLGVIEMSRVMIQKSLETIR